MIKNLEFAILNPNGLEKVEDFNPEFSSISYYFFLKLRKIKIASCSYLKIRISNQLKVEAISYTLANGILFIGRSYDFTTYLKLPDGEKIKFQLDILYNILKSTFIHYNIDWKVLDDIKNEIIINNWELKYKWTEKKINKTIHFSFFIYMNIDSLIFIGEIIEAGKKEDLFIFKSIPGYFVIEVLFKAFKLKDNKVLIGSKEKAVFDIDILNKKVSILDDENVYLKKLSYKKGYKFQNDW